VKEKDNWKKLCKKKTLLKKRKKQKKKKEKKRKKNMGILKGGCWPQKRKKGMGGSSERRP